MCAWKVARAWSRSEDSVYSLSEIKNRKKGLLQMQVIHSHQVRNRCQASYTDSDTDLAPLLNIRVPSSPQVLQQQKQNLSPSLGISVFTYVMHLLLLYLYTTKYKSW